MSIFHYITPNANNCDSIQTILPKKQEKQYLLIYSKLGFRNSVPRNWYIGLQ